MTIATREPVTKARVEELVSEFDGRPAEDVIGWVVDTFGDRVALSTSFQAEGMVVLDMASRLGRGVRVVTVDTGRLPPETYELIDEVRDRYGIDVEVHLPDQQELAEMVGRHGVNPFYKGVSLRLLCCEIRKVNPVNKVLATLDAWMTGLRRSQSATRSDVEPFELDEAHGGILKVNPLAHWPEEQVWDYIRSNDVPYNRLYDKGYTSIGCAPCTRPTQEGEDPRAGRWWWESGVAKECGIHMSPSGMVIRTPSNGHGAGPGDSKRE